jgi:hypothetical protein
MLSLELLSTKQSPIRLLSFTNLQNSNCPQSCCLQSCHNIYVVNKQNTASICCLLGFLLSTNQLHYWLWKLMLARWSIYYCWFQICGPLVNKRNQRMKLLAGAVSIKENPPPPWFSWNLFSESLECFFFTTTKEFFWSSYLSSSWRICAVFFFMLAE